MNINRQNEHLGNVNAAERLNLQNIGSPQFSDAADLILDGLEDAFGILAPRGRETTKRAVINILSYYCLPNPERCAGERPKEEYRL